MLIIYIILGLNKLIMNKFLKIIFSFIWLLFSNISTGQIYVSDNSYIFNKGNIVYSKGELELNGVNSNLYLRNEGQFLQGTLGNSVNKGIGKLSVFQEGTSNNYGYNYWCSPIGNATTSAGNENFGITMLKLPTSPTLFNNPTISSATYDGVSGTASLTIASYWIFKFLASDNYSQWIPVGSASTLVPGEGFTMKGTSGSDTTDPGESSQNNTGSAQRYDFRGKPNDGTIDITVTGPTIGTQYPNSTLTGNPYPSAINLNYFLLENSGYTINYATGVYASGGPLNVINGEAYFWEHVKPATSHLLTQYVGGYGIYVPNGLTANSPGTYAAPTFKTYNIDGSVNTTGASSGSNYKRMFSPIGQGFMVQGKGIGTFTAKMKNIYRVFVKEGTDPTLSNSQFERQSTSLLSNNWDEMPNVAAVDYTLFSKDEVPQIKVHTIFNNQFTRETILAFNPYTTDGYDNAMDAVSQDITLPNDAYFSLVNNDKPFVISTISFDVNKRIPFTLKAGSQTTFKIGVSDIVNFTGANTIYLFDNTTGIYHDIKNGFYETTLPAGIHSNRYLITFLNNEVLNVGDLVKETFLVMQDNSNQMLTISNPNLLEIKNVQLFDISGKQIFNKQKLTTNSNYEFSTASFSDGVYLVKINSKDTQTKTQKIIISNK